MNGYCDAPLDVGEHCGERAAWVVAGRYELCAKHKHRAKRLGGANELIPRETWERLQRGT